MKRSFYLLSNLFLVAALGVMLSGCVAPQVATPVIPAVDLQQFKSVSVAVIDQVNTPYSRDGLPMFAGMLEGRFESAGYTVMDAHADMVVKVTVAEFTPGDRTTRLLVGFGAGRALLKYTARFEDARGNLLAEMNGGKQFHGGEFVDNPTFKSDESIRMGLISRSVSQIGAFIGQKRFARQVRDPVAP
jgi:hypothetical protein